MERRQRPRSFDPLVVFVAGGATALFLIVGVLFTQTVGDIGKAVWELLATWFGWVYVLATAGFVFFALLLGFSRYGTIKLGNDDDQPEFPVISWVGMMFAVGVGIGLIFYGAAEPVMLWADPPPDTAGPRTQAAAVVGMRYSLFHWAFHVWAFFGVVGLALAYVSHRRGYPAMVTSAFVPLIGERAEQGPGRVINTFVVFATLVGNAVTLGLGALQITSGLTYIADIAESTALQAAVVGVLTIGFVLSAVSGVSRGVQFLGNANIVLALALMLFLVVVGPLQSILDLMLEGFGAYVFNFIPMSFQTGWLGGDEWMRNWTIFFWAWGISWAPYVGTFLARISRGRTIREYVLGVLILPSMVTVVWFAIVGGTALNLQITGQANLAEAAAQAPQAAMFVMLQEFPLWPVFSGVVIALAAIFFVSGADAGAIVLGTFSSWGTMHPKRWLVVMWGLLIGFVALVLLIVGGLNALQWAAVVAASPFVLILIVMCVGLYKSLGTDPSIRDRPTHPGGRTRRTINSAIGWKRYRSNSAASPERLTPTPVLSPPAPACAADLARSAAEMLKRPTTSRSGPTEETRQRPPVPRTRGAPMAHHVSRDVSWSGWRNHSVGISRVWMTRTSSKTDVRSASRTRTGRPRGGGWRRPPARAGSPWTKWKIALHGHGRRVRTAISNSSYETCRAESSPGRAGHRRRCASPRRCAMRECADRGRYLLVSSPVPGAGRCCSTSVPPSTTTTT